MDGMIGQAIQNAQDKLAPWLILVVAVILSLKMLQSALKVGRRSKKGSWRRGKDAFGNRDMRDPKQQADAIARVDFVKTPLMNRGEYRVFAILERSINQLGRGYRVMAQVNLGEILKPDDKTPETLRAEAFASINSKRVDFLIIDRIGHAALAIEVQGSGHYLGNTAFMRDAVKKEALRRAGVPLLEATPDMRPDEIVSQMTRLLGIETDDRRSA